MPDCFAVTMLVPYGNSRSECWTWANDNVTSKVDGFVKDMATQLLEKTRDLRADSAQTQLVKQKREHRIQLAASNQRADGEQRRAEHAEMELRRQHATDLSDGDESGDDPESNPTPASRKGKERQNEPVRTTTKRSVQFANADTGPDEQAATLMTDSGRRGDQHIPNGTTSESMPRRQRPVDRPHARPRNSAGPVLEHSMTTNFGRHATVSATGPASQLAQSGLPKAKAKTMPQDRNVESMDVDGGWSISSDVHDDAPAGADEQTGQDRRSFTKGEWVITAAGPSRTKRGRDDIDNDDRVSDKRRKTSAAGPSQVEPTPAPPPSAGATLRALVSRMTKEENTGGDE